MAATQSIAIDRPGMGPARRLAIYAALTIVAAVMIFPLFWMVSTSLKTLPEVWQGNVFSPPMHITFDAWFKAWNSACTGLHCEGLKVGFWNSVKITVPSILISIAIGSLNGYALAHWPFRGATFFFSLPFQPTPASA